MKFYASGVAKRILSPVFERSCFDGNLLLSPPFAVYVQRNFAKVLTMYSSHLVLLVNCTSTCYRNGMRRIIMKACKALILLDHAPNRNLLCERLRQCELAFSDDINQADATYNLCFVDAPALERLHSQILKMKHSAEPAYFFCFLMKSEESDATIPHLYSACVDQILAAPFSDSELQFFIDAARHNHRTVFQKKIAIAEEKENQPYQSYRIVAELIGKNSSETNICTISGLIGDKQTENTLFQNEYRLHQVLDALPFGVFIIDAEGMIVYGNDAGEKIWSGTCYVGIENFAEYKGRWLSTGKQIEPDEWAAARALRNGEISIDEEIEIECFDDTRKIILHSAFPLYDDQRHIIGGVVVIQDITQRKYAENQLRAQAEILANMTEGVIVTDEHGVIFYANAAMERMYGYAPGELIGKSATVLNTAPADEAHKLMMNNILVLKKLGHLRSEFKSRRKNGEIFITASRISYINIGEKAHIIAMQQDVTELKKSKETRQFLAAIVQSTDDAIIGCSLDGTVLSWNPAAEAMYGYTRDEMRGQSISLLAPAKNKNEFAETIAQAMRDQGLNSFETTRLRKNGTVIDVSLTLSPIRDAANNVIGVAKIARDITEKKKAEENLRLWGRAIEASCNGIVIVDVAAQGQPIVYANPAFQLITGYETSEIVGRNPRFLLRDDLSQAGLDEIRVALREQREGRATLRNYRKDGQLFWNEFSIAPVREEDGRVIYYIGVLNDVTERKRNETELEYLATHDALTRLPNRILLEDRLQQAIERAKRDGRIVAVLYIDLDRFKIVNDSVGHEGGDKLLRQISERISSVFRAGDTVARQGGDEFVVVLERIESEKNAADLAQRLMQVMASPFTVADAQFYANCSIGISLFPKDGMETSELLKNADAAMYRAKDLGGNNFQFYTPPMNERARERLEIENALRNGFNRGEFILHYQPQVDLLTGAVVGVEALLRWQHPELGLIAPNRFIEIAEETGLIVPIGAWVLRSACAQAKAWQQAGFANLRVAINLSARQFAYGNLVDLITNILDETGLAAEYLDIELTESLVMSDVEQAISILNDLRSLGVQISIDDFGTGYSSLSYLKKFPIDVLKIDRSFVQEIELQSKDAAITDAIISMAHGLGIRVIAEGVETEAQCEFLSRSMCDEIQGFLFSKALSVADMTALLLEGRRMPDHLLRLYKPSRRLLLVDDEPNILNALKRLMRRDGYQILTASSGKEGLDVLAQHDIDVIVSDQRMPGMTGVEFLRTVKNLYPDTVRIVLSGFTELQTVTDAVNEGAIYKFLTKPWDDQQLREHVAKAFQDKEMADENRRLGLEVRAANHELAKANRQLEELLRQKQQQIKRSIVSLDIVREALQHVPQPVIGLDDDDIVAFVNVAAQNLFSDAGPILGSEATQLMPELIHKTKEMGDDEIFCIELKGIWFEVVSRSMGNGSQSRGKIITLTQCDSVAADHAEGMKL
jgi:diguanylate cyclase (GGDEF)-like protein/PAS domain S-box-containing protein